MSGAITMRFARCRSPRSIGLKRSTSSFRPRRTGRGTTRDNGPARRRIPAGADADREHDRGRIHIGRHPGGVSFTDWSEAVLLMVLGASCVVLRRIGIGCARGRTMAGHEEVPATEPTGSVRTIRGGAPHDRRRRRVRPHPVRGPPVASSGVFAEVPATALGAHAITAALERAGVAPEEVDRVVGGQVLQAGAGQNPARQSAVGAGIPLTVPAITLNAVCLSGLEAVAEGARMIADGRARIVVAVGQESMSLAPHAWPGSRLGKRYGSIEFLDTMDHDGLTDAFEHRSMGASTEDRNEANHVTREEQDAWAAQSHARLEAGAESLAGRDRARSRRPAGAGRTISADDGLRPGTTVETLAGAAARLHPDRRHHGRQLEPDHRRRRRGRADGRVPGRRADAARPRCSPPPSSPARTSPSTPSPRTRRCRRSALAGRDVAELQVVEINEAFAAVAVVSTRLLGVDPLIVNMNGGAIALGHPIGASGTRIAGHVARTLAALGPRQPRRRRDLRRGRAGRRDRPRRDGALMSADLTSAHAVVTGGASGIGAAIAQALAGAGAHVVVADLDGEAAAARSRTRSAARCGRWTCRSPRSSTTLTLTADILVNNAGVQTVSPVEDFDPARWRFIVDLMLVAPFQLARAALPGMYERGWGRVINVSSVHGLRASAYKSAYVAAKHGLEGLSKTIALEGGGRGVTSNCVNPSYVRTPLVERQIADQAKVHGIPEDRVVEEIMLTESAVKRLVEPAEVADLVLWLTGDTAAMVNGASYTMDGGWTGTRNDIRDFPVPVDGGT